MTARMQDWVRLPTDWIQNRGLAEFRWAGGFGSDNAAALMTLVALAHRADQQHGVSMVTYDTLTCATQLSRAKVSAGLSVLEDHRVIARGVEGRSTYALNGFDLTRGWAKLPARLLYQSDSITAFRDFKLRRPAELNALKLYLLFVAGRGRDTNMANISYDKIAEQTGVERNRIKQALTILAVAGLVHVERIPSAENEYAVANGYRIAHLDPYVHMGTRGRTLEAEDFV
ncbi:hypothetical protein [Phenylobacterium montanum]|uniref:Helix-turn-helix domain-containing protein n=1 Tax=Phenylobacterium montanum TaxID=2823693 RepID=A0A975FW51_9CAUL|nr:hypothetical protein [Caulobacter sp. S6]QUD86241.1 hypothetical protein KCG34_14155 [Caulobacter sp. S6]